MCRHSDRLEHFRLRFRGGPQSHPFPFPLHLYNTPHLRPAAPQSFFLLAPSCLPHRSFSVRWIGAFAPTAHHTSTTGWSSLPLVGQAPNRYRGLPADVFSAFFITLFATWAWIKNKMTVERFVARTNQGISREFSQSALPPPPPQLSQGLLDIFTTVVEQLDYLRLSRLLEFASAVVVDANDTRRASPLLGSRRSNPVSAPRRFWSRRRQSLGDNSQPPENV